MAKNLGSFGQLRVLLRKNWILHKRSPVGSLCELILPLFILGFSIAFFYLITNVLNKVQFSSSPSNYTTFKESSSYQLCNSPNECYLGVVPNNNKTIPEFWTLMDGILSNLEGTSVKYFTTEQELETYYTKNPATIWAGIVFDSLHNYTIRVNNSVSPVEVMSYGFKISSGSSSPWDSNGFVAIQVAIESAIISVLTGNSTLLSNLQIEDYPQSIQDSIGNLLPFAIVGFMNWAFYPLLIVSVVSLVREKQERVKETLNMMGMSDKVYWLSWFITLVIPALWIALANAIIGHFAFVYKNSNPFVVFLLFVSYGIAVISFSFLISTIASKTSIAVVVSILIMYLGNSFSFFFKTLSTSVTSLGCVLLSPIGFSMGAINLLQLEIQGEGAHLNNFYKGEFPILLSIMLTFGNAALNFLFAWYILNVFPGQFGIPKPFYFFLMPSFWCTSLNRSSGTPSEEESSLLESSKDESYFESPRRDLIGKEGIKIRGLRKEYKGENEIVAVRGLNLDIYRGELFGFLGTNGAGKSTTISMLIGLFQPSKGDALIEGMNIIHEMDSIRNVLGVCPQDNILFDNLTGAEHLYLFGKLKGVSDQSIDQEVKEVLTTVGLGSKGDSLAKTYSGGTKRKLCVAMALIGNPKVLILDEPTSGVDSLSKRDLWNILRKIRKDRTIILTTHSMEEADVLADRIGIMKNGELTCCGTSLFLKQRFGTGYCLNAIFHENSKSESRSIRLLEKIQEFVPKASILNQTSYECSLSLPTDGEDTQITSVFPKLLGAIESDIQKNGPLEIKSYAVSMSTLEDVFLNITSKDALASRSQYSGKEETVNVGEVLVNKAQEIDDEISAAMNVPASFKSQLRALLKKRVLTIARSWKSSLLILFLPFVIVCMAGLSSKLSFTQNTSDLPPLSPFEISNYFPLQIPYVTNSSVNATTQQYLRDILSMQSASNLGFIEIADIDALNDFVIKNQQPEYQYGSLIFSNEGNGFDGLIIYYGNSQDSAVPTFLNLVNNGILKFMTKNNSVNFPITVNSHPFPGDSSIQGAISNNIYLSITISMMIGYSVSIALLCKNLVYEKEKKIKLQMYMMGAGVLNYLLSNLIPDFLLLYLSGFIWFISIPIFSLEAYSGIYFSGLFVIFPLFLLGLLALNYLFSSIFSNSETCLKFFIFFNLGTVLLPYLVSYIPLFIGKAEPIYWITLLLPFSAFCSALGNLQSLHTTAEYLGPVSSSSFFGIKNLGSHIIAITVEIIAFGILLYFIENSHFKFYKTTVGPRSSQNEDEDVAKERKRIEENFETSNDIIKLQDVSKLYGSSLAVNHLTFGLQPNQCFGLLGANGAGKTTTIAMLTREISPSDGKLEINGKSIWSVNTSHLYREAKLSSCLQFDALCENLTPGEHIELYARLRNEISDDQIAKLKETMIDRMNLNEHTKKFSKNLSGGNKRKLSTALALLNGNRIIFLDEPSTGMDPGARRHMWTAIDHEKKKLGRAVVLTTHSIDEAETCCNRIGIMAKGEFQCLGSPQHLKSRFGEKYFVFVNCREESAQLVDAFIQKTFVRVN